MSLSLDNVTTVILAGGQGSRLEGVDKGLSLLHQQPMIETVLAKIYPQNPQLVINANRNIDIYQKYGFPVFEDLDTGYLGPLAGLYTALSQAKTEWVISVPCDAPDVAPNYIASMLKHAENKVPVVASIDGRLQPTFSLTPKSRLAELRAYLDNGDRAAGRWFKTQHCISVDFSDHAKHFANLNDAQAMSEWERQT
ncbi:MAG: molybdenum cofactor guanylyltransferase [Methylococcales bacterium]|jgi:molybdenum cofactor guanylyltransferase|nr:molybdenum cofactor guanylyltransferase [Methylococcales bacterium]MBT7443268.1 molybdenum cofactor guanylyltransferase [Methylococcales bacterium]